MKCWHKKRFATAEEADRHGRLVLQVSYRCPHCGHFHLTKNAQLGEPGGREREDQARQHDAAVRRAKEDGKHKMRRLRRAGRTRR